MAVYVLDVGDFVLVVNNCGTGGGGFKPGNTCARGGKKGGGGIGGGGGSVPFTPATLPTSLEGMTEVKTLGGSTGAKLFKDDDGNQFVIKYGNHSAHVLEETFANQMYRAAGVDVPATTIISGEGNKIAQIAAYVEGKTLGQLKGEEQKAAIKEVQKNFATDALLANWDVAGMSKDNILVDTNGKVHRIDNGGSLRYRAQGAPKGSAFGNEVYELDTMRKQGSAAPVFKDLTDEQVADQIYALQAKKQAILDAAPQTIRPTLEKRFTYMEEWAAKKTGKSSPVQPVKLPSPTIAASPSLQGSHPAIGIVAKLPKKVESYGSSDPMTKSALESLHPTAGGVVNNLSSASGPAKFTSLQLAKIEFMNPEGLKGGTLHVQQGLKTEQINHLKATFPGVQVVGVNIQGKHMTGAAVSKASPGLKTKIAAATSVPDAIGVIDGKTMTIKGPNGPVSLEDITVVTPKGTKLIGAKPIPGLGTGQVSAGTIKLDELSGSVKGMTTSPKKNSAQLAQWKADLSPNETSAVMSWTNGEYVQMRKRIGKGEPNQKDKDLLSALEKAPKYDGTIYRGISVNGWSASKEEDYGVQLSQSLCSAGVGAIWTDPAPMSLSRSPSKAMDVGGSGVVLRVKSKTCRMVENTSYHKTEAEVMGNGTQKFRITGLVKNVKVGGNPIGLLVDMEEID